MPRSRFTAAETEPSLPTLNWSRQQLDIFEWGTNGTGNMVVRARAGSAKTTTAIEMVNRAPEEEIFIGAFNADIAKVMKDRKQRAVDVLTIHGLGLRHIGRRWRWVKVAGGRHLRSNSLTDKVTFSDTPKWIKAAVGVLHTKVRELSPLHYTLNDCMRIAIQFDLGPDSDDLDDLEQCCEFAAAACTVAATEPPDRVVGVDYADMIFLPLTHNLLYKQYGMVVGDEIQDFSAPQLLMLQGVCDGRFALFGDDRQAIYGFRGADSGSLDRLKGELDATEYPLTTTYRCAQQIVARARRLVPDIQGHPPNPEGLVDDVDFDSMLAGARGGDFILSRLNAPLVASTLRLLRRGVRARMAGRDIGEDIVRLVDRLTKRSSDMYTLRGELEKWRKRKVSQALAHGDEEMADKFRDKAAVLQYLMDDCGTITELRTKISWLFVDKKEDNVVLCSSIHKAKGLEANRVWLLQQTLYRRGVTLEEQNLDYVATTRAKNHLTLVYGVPGL